MAGIKGMKGHIPWNKGKKHSKKTKRKMSKTHKNNYREGKTKPYVRTEEIRNKTSKSSKGLHGGEKCNLWKGGIWSYERRLFLNAKRRAMKKGAVGSHTQGEWELLKVQYGYTCPACGRSEPEIKLTQDHVIPLVKGGSDWIENIQPLCRSCNSKKHTKVTDYRKEKT